MTNFACWLLSYFMKIASNFQLSSLWIYSSLRVICMIQKTRQNKFYKYETTECFIVIHSKNTKVNKHLVYPRWIHWNSNWTGQLRQWVLKIDQKKIKMAHNRRYWSHYLLASARSFWILALKKKFSVRLVNMYMPQYPTAVLLGLDIGLIIDLNSSQICCISNYLSSSLNFVNIFVSSCWSCNCFKFWIFRISCLWISLVIPALIFWKKTDSFIQKHSKICLTQDN